MIKRIRSGTSVVAHEQWRSLDESVEVELTSEDPEWPIEHALLDQRASGWRAAAAGSQTISLLWREPTSIRRIRLVCEEHSRARTRSSRSARSRLMVNARSFGSSSHSHHPGRPLNVRSYATNLDAVSRLELIITPAIDGGNAVATLKEWRIA